MRVPKSAMQERRRFVRLDPSLVGVTYNVIGQEGEGSSQPAKDISHGGVRFLVGERLPNGARLELELKLPEEGGSIQAQAEVVWCARFRDEGRYEVGCRFTQIDPLDRGKIIHRIHERLKQRKPWA